MPVQATLSKQDTLRVGRAEVFRLLVAPLGVLASEQLEYRWDTTTDELVITRMSIASPLTIPDPIAP